MNHRIFSQLTPSGRVLKHWWSYYFMDTTFSKYSSTDYFPSQYIQVATFDTWTNNTQNILVYFFCLFYSKCTVLSNENKTKTPKCNKLITLSVLACHFFSYSHLFSFSQLETREKASNMKPFWKLE